MTARPTPSLLSTRDLGKAYAGTGWRRGTPRTVLAGIELAVAAEECVALIGRSGSGKSTLARLLLGLERPDAGAVRFRGQDLAGLDRAGQRRFRAAVQMVLQDPLSAVNPRHDIGRIVAEPLRHLTDLPAAERVARVGAMLSLVGLDPASSGRLPGQLSGGQVQRVGLARALATRPALVVLDEAVSNLDAPLQVEILDRLAALRRQQGTAFLLVTHDVRLARRFADRVLVLEGGRIVDAAPCRPRLDLTHPAARALVDAVLPAYPEGAR
ncbi:MULTISPECIES: ATP-binding cassette domain-containing protein [Methylobacterium]|uniref:ATP-binding cassette domain-containing protein n=1 Tax=Methylobacterium longum TaxID=767694 RepID=A0ABT8AJR0_9HYPH|nr:MULTISPECIES: ATP-binding cassette domain-containing protein [Methylobacterium]MCJ2102021.1 ATP-binding cassette domain-containing protein [Methylobacterium sp. E-046]MDN3570112.1 ATP-binding cassette domain-containing protein [Methylobacterium longum]GJE12186.1 Nickel import ATP-binding protein NikE [Methylobacterium longum]